MTAQQRYTLGPDAATDEELYDSHGNPVDATYIDQAVDDVDRALSGRPSLSGRRTRSPQIAFRLPAAEREQAQQLAEQQGVSVSELARRALEEHLRRAS
ncbi:ribbon-helix-helix protein, CopG family [Actinopolyspora halophila]|uniref:ribbon-helix-helix protein, CopG family n=1 Tax=Actinopolyspora halophila TaxID=1850 RepID=UPI00037E408F|nr:ribbon-helix-helix protein, CopG family [Actinopolyspora halophila]